MVQMFNFVKKVDESFLKDLLKDTNAEFSFSVAAALIQDLDRLWQMKNERMHTVIIKFEQGVLAVFKFYRADESIERAILNNADVELIVATFNALDGENE